MVSLHVPVLLQEVLTWLDPRPGGLYVDATVGTGGHAEAILERILPGGRLVGLDLDPEALAVARRRLERFGDAVQLVQANFADLQHVLRTLGIARVQGVLMDLGVSGLQLATPHRGFSFRLAGPLDMRMDPASPVTAADLVNRLSEKELADLLRRYGEEPFAARIAREIVRRRPLSTTQELREAVLRAVPRRAWPRRVDVATRTFQALRIAVNRELEALEQALPQAVEVLGLGGRLVVISFHSLEDRIVKHALRSAKPLRVLTPKPIRPSPEEVRANPHARSARLRAAERIEP
ncbi:MAG: 16S rRNA (cytosine(1402)-N(4))-methyltransferase RsmH [Armatimonadota bacterium]|nr:16S rRNA (cytosine(1402)-N(4))-methyltransferase RsmH [Armatimonadota bacterium]MDR7569761.1 16S rRNA (cytosine(1402)-N(4))-methyltransferase RsmH [Armatimonadota bacterium]MDR7614085.1 16S rRNA (cytosine(1402)-N(4))-methyltransferase RsmH [Armatimonadota bacterium]